MRALTPEEIAALVILTPLVAVYFALRLYLRRLARLQVSAALRRISRRVSR